MFPSPVYPPISEFDRLFDVFTFSCSKAPRIVVYGHVVFRYRRPTSSPEPGFQSDKHWMRCAPSAHVNGRRHHSRRPLQGLTNNVQHVTHPVRNRLEIRRSLSSAGVPSVKQTQPLFAVDLFLKEVWRSAAGRESTRLRPRLIARQTFSRDA